MTANLKSDLIAILERDFDPHQRRIEDASLKVTTLEDGHSTCRIRVEYRVLEVRGCAGPHVESERREDLNLKKMDDHWILRQ